VPPEDSKENECSVREGYRIVSSYPVGIGRIWIITEWDRSSSQSGTAPLLRTFARRVLAILDGRNVAVFGATLLSPVV
jgi:hypothetical protein